MCLIQSLYSLHVAEGRVGRAESESNQLPDHCDLNSSSPVRPSVRPTALISVTKPEIGCAGAAGRHAKQALLDKATSWLTKK